MDLSEEEEGDVRSLDEPSEAEPLASEVSCAAADPSTLPGSLVERLLKIQSNQEDMEIQWSKIDSIASGQMHVDRELTQYGKMRSSETEMNRHSDPSDFVDA